MSLVTTSSKEIFVEKKRKISPLGFERLRGWYTVLLLQWGGGGYYIGYFMDSRHHNFKIVRGLGGPNGTQSKEK